MLEDFKLPVSLILKQLDEIEGSSFGNSSTTEKLNAIRKNAFQLQYLFKQLTALRKLELGEIRLEKTINDLEAFFNAFSTIFTINRAGGKINLPANIEIIDKEVCFDPVKLEEVFYSLLRIYWELSPSIEQVTLNVYQKKKNNTKGSNNYIIEIAGKTPDLTKNQLKKFQQAAKIKTPLNPEIYGKLPINIAICTHLIGLYSGQIAITYSKAKALKFTLQFPIVSGNTKDDISPIKINESSYFQRNFEEYNYLQSENNKWAQFNHKYQLNLGNIDSANQQFLTKVLALIETHLDDENYWVDELVADMFISRSTFFRRLKKITEQAPNDFMRAIRLKCAAELLRENKYNISEVSYRIGFKNPNYFGTCFRQMYGVPPSAYANQSALTNN